MNTGKRAAITGFILLKLFWSHLCLFAQTPATTKPAAEARLALREGWSLQTSAKVEAKGEVISTPRLRQQDGMPRPFQPRWWPRW